MKRTKKKKKKDEKNKKALRKQVRRRQRQMVNSGSKLWFFYAEPEHNIHANVLPQQKKEYRLLTAHDSSWDSFGFCGLFLVACTRLYNPLCPSVGQSVGWLVMFYFFFYDLIF